MLRNILQFSMKLISDENTLKCEVPNHITKGKKTKKKHM